MLSLLYSGTPALKTDFTRTGRRTAFGALADLKYSLTRYVLNNFTDGYIQDCLQVASGKYKPHETPPKVYNRLRNVCMEFVTLFAILVVLFPKRILVANGVLRSVARTARRVILVGIKLYTVVGAVFPDLTPPTFYFSDSKVLKMSHQPLVEANLAQSRMIPFRYTGWVPLVCCRTIPCLTDDSDYSACVGRWDDEGLMEGTSLLDCCPSSVEPKQMQEDGSEVQFLVDAFAYSLGLVSLGIIFSLFLVLFIYMRGASVATKSSFCSN